MNTTREIAYLKSAKDKWIYIAVITTFSGFFLLFFQPFGINNFDPNFTISAQLLNVVISLTFQNSIILTINEFIFRQRILKTWNLKYLLMWIVWTCILLSSATFIFYNWQGNWHDFVFTSYIEFIVDVSAMLAIPITGVLLYFNYRETKNEANALHHQLKSSNKFIEFTSENKKDILRIATDNILYLEGQENYVAVYYLENNSITKKLLRSTMQGMEVQLKNSPIIRCHRSYFINSAKITHANRQASLYTLQLEGLQNEIPVSDKFKENVNDQFDLRN